MIAVVADEPQRYRISSGHDGSGRFVSQPTHDVDGLDQRGRAIGLGPLDQREDNG